MEPGITWYDVLGVLPGAEAAKIRREYDAKTNLLRPELISGAPSNVLQAISRAQGMLDHAWEVLGDPASRGRYDESIGLRHPGGGLRQPGSIPTGTGLESSDLGVADDLGGDTAGGVLTLTGWLGPHRRRAKQQVAVPDMRGLFYTVCLEVAARRNVHVTTVRLTPHPMPVEGLVVDQSPRPPAKLQRHGELTIYVWHPPARLRAARDLSRGRTGLVAAAGTVPGQWTGAMTDHIVVGDRVLLEAGFHAARARLEILAGDEMLFRVCEAAYGTGITHLVAAAGPAAGLTRLAAAYLARPTGTDGCAHVSLRWEAIAADGALFTTLEADLMLFPAGDQNTTLALAGGYRPQPGPAGAGLDKAIVRRCATVAIRSFVAQVAGALVHPAGTAGPAIVP